jgi:hypothetical protein
MISQLANIQTKYPKKFIWVFVLLNILFIPGIFKLIDNVEPSLEKVLPQHIEEIQHLNQLRNEFGVDMIYLLVYTNGIHVSDVRNYEYLTYVDLLSQSIKNLDYVEHVESISTLLKAQTGKDYILYDTYQVKHFFEINPFTFDFISQDYSFSVIKVQTTTGPNAKIIDSVLKDIKNQISKFEDKNPGTKIEITGSTAIDNATFKTIISDFSVITLVSMVVIGIVVFITFGNFSKGMLPMIIVMNAVLMTMGIVGYLGLTLTVVSMVAAAIIMGLGIDFGIHQVHSYYEHRKTLSPKQSIQETLKELFKAMLGASLTTIGGFLALLFGELPAMKVLGIILSLGIFTTLIGAILLLPPIIYLYDVQQIKKNGNKK